MKRLMEVEVLLPLHCPRPHHDTLKKASARPNHGLFTLVISLPFPSQSGQKSVEESDQPEKDTRCRVSHTSLGGKYTGKRPERHPYKYLSHRNTSPLER